MSYVEFEYGAETFAANVRSFYCYGYTPLLGFGQSRGDNRVRGGQIGRQPRDRVRDQLTVPLDWHVRGYETFAGGVGVSYHDQLKLNLYDLGGWFDAAPAGLFTVRVVVGATTWEGEAHHEGFADAVWQGRQYEVQQTVTVYDGALAVQP